MHILNSFAVIELPTTLSTLFQHPLILISTRPPNPAGTGGSAGSFAIVGLQIGEVFVGVQPLLGV